MLTFIQCPDWSRIEKACSEMRDDELLFDILMSAGALERMQEWDQFNYTDLATLGEYAWTASLASGDESIRQFCVQFCRFYLDRNPDVLLVTDLPLHPDVAAVSMCPETVRKWAAMLAEINWELLRQVWDDCAFAIYAKQGEMCPLTDYREFADYATAILNELRASSSEGCAIIFWVTC